MTKPEAVIVFILAVWLVAGVLYALFNRRLGRFSNRWDLFRWISAYQLFSEAQRSFKLSFRDESADKQLTEWQSVSLAPKRKWYHAIWFPEGLTSEIVCSVLDELVKFRESKQKAPELENFSERFIYRFVLSFVRRFPANENMVARQFKIEETDGFAGNDQLREIFISEFHER